MARNSNSEKFENDQEAQDDKITHGFKSTGDDRQDIARIIADPLFRKLASSEALLGYQELASGNESHNIPVDQIKKMRQYIVEEWTESQVVFERINRELDRAIGNKTASQKDKDYLLNTLFFNESEHFSKDKFTVAEKLIGEKVDRMKDDRKAYDNLRHDPLVKDGVLIVDANTKVKIPSEDAYLKMSVPERRDFLSKAKSSLAKAKEYSRKVGSVESAEHNKHHKEELDSALKKKIIGKKTYVRLKKSLEPGAKHVEGELEKELTQHESLWAKIRGTLRGETLAELEKKLDNSDYGELLALFGMAKENESKKLLKNYKEGSPNQKGLDGYLEEGIISQHSYNEFTEAFDQQNLERQYTWLDSLPAQMDRYQTLHSREKSLSKKHRNILDTNFDEWGFKEREAFLASPDNPKYQDNFQQKMKSTRMLGVIKDQAKRQAIIRTNMDLTKRGAEKKQTFLTRLKNMFERKTSDSVGAQDFQKKLRDSRLQKSNTHTEVVSMDKNASTNLMDMQANLRKKRVSEDAIHEELDTAETRGGRVIHDEGFDQVEQRDDSGRKSRTTRIEINQIKGMDRFFSEDQKGAFKSKEQGGHDDLKLAIKKTDGTKVELDLKEIRAMKKFIEEETKLDKAV